MVVISSAFGLRFLVDEPIPGLPADAVQFPTWDVEVQLGTAPSWISQIREGPLPPEAWHTSSKERDGRPSWTIWQVADGGLFRLIFLDGTEFLVDRSGSRVWAVWSAPLARDDIAAYFLGPVMGFLLTLRGMVCLHSSAVAVTGQALALAGPSGAGKSTLTGAMARRGVGVLADDIVALTGKRDGGKFLVPPGYPRLRLWPDSVRMLYGESQVLPPMTPNWDKRYADLTGEGYLFQTAPLPLGAIYILHDREQTGAPCIAPLTGRDALVALTANRYFPLPGKTALADAFDLLGRLVANVPVRRVIPHDDPAHLPRLREMILDDFHALRSGQQPLCSRALSS